MMEDKNRVFIFIMVLFCLNILAHFLPFERASLGNDDYAILAKFQKIQISEIASTVFKQPDRPLAFLAMVFQEKFTGSKLKIAFYLILFSNFIVLVSIFFLLAKLFNDYFLAFIASLIYCLLPNKLEVYHIPIYIYQNIASFIYILSFIFFIYYENKRNKLFFAISLFLYTIAIFLFETGFLLPFVLMAYLYFYRKQNIKPALYFFISSIFYLIFKFTNALGMGSDSPLHFHPPSLALLPTNLIDLFHQYLGRYMVRNVIYGVYKFFSIESPWLIIISLLNITIITIAALWLQKKEIPKLNNRLLLLGTIIFIFFITPILLNNAGGVAGRHLILPSIGVAIFGVWLLEKAKKQWRIIFLFFVALTLIICQGNAWLQVVACRINSAVFETLKEKKEDLLKADNIIIDTRSFADSIPFTLTQRDFNVLNTYYGAQAFEDWGLESMVKLTIGDATKSIYIATESPKIIWDGSLEFTISEYQGYRSVSKKTIKLPQKETVVIVFKDVFGETFGNGIRNR